MGFGRGTGFTSKDRTEMAEYNVRLSDVSQDAAETTPTYTTEVT